MTNATCTWRIHTYPHNRNPHWEKDCGYTAALDDPYTPVCGHCHKPVVMIGSVVHRHGAMPWRKTADCLPPAGVQVYVLMWFKGVVVKGMYNGLFPHEAADYGELGDVQRWWQFLNDRPFQVFELPDWWVEIMEPE